MHVLYMYVHVYTHICIRMLVLSGTKSDGRLPIGPWPELYKADMLRG